MSIATTIMHRPEPIKERVEQTTLGITAIEILHLTRFTPLLLLWAQCYICSGPALSRLDRLLPIGPGATPTNLCQHFLLKLLM